ncbi:MAG TPA: NAD-dependent epimerase/dehydratase family protein, partial [Alteraurantiacibacter sp.]
MILDEDIAALAPTLAPVWAKLEGARIFMTGGTGFIGRWMLEALVCAPIEAEVTVLSRNPRRFVNAAPHLARHVTFLKGDVTAFEISQAGFTHVIHGATDASAALTASDPNRMFA